MARFVDNLLRLRDSSEKLELCEFLIRDTMYIDIRLWIQKASMLKPRILIIDYKEELSLQIHIMPLIFGDLSTLELKSVDLRDELLDFSRCPALKNLLLRFCFIGLTKNISSQSLEHLTIMYCTFLSDAHIRISAPSLISLVLFENYGNTPFLDSMPSLVNASVKLHDCEYRCCQEEYGILCSDNGCRKCGANVDRSRDCVLLKGLSKAKSLELVAQRGVFLFERDLMCCPTFCNLKTLLLNDWSVASDLHPLLCFLQQTPVLEKLTLQLGQTPVNWVEPEGGYNTLEQSFPSKKLKVAEVFYEEFDTRVEAISRILKAHGMYLQHIQQTKRPSELIQVVRCVQMCCRSMVEQNKLAETCYCSECDFKGSPMMLLHHLAEKSGPHSWPVQKINYDTSYPFVRPVGKEHRCLLVAEEDSAVFLLAVDKSSSVEYPVELVCIRGESDVTPVYLLVLAASGPDPVSSTSVSLIKDMLSSSVPNEVDLGNVPYLREVMWVHGELLHRELKEIRLRFSILRFPGK